MDGRLWLLCGLSFAGKSTLARAIADESGATIISLDAINEQRGVGFGGDGLSPSVWGGTLEIALERLDAALARHEDVIIDDTCCFRWLRDRYREVAERHACEVLLVHIEVPLAEIQRRRRQNDASNDRRAIRDEIFDQHLATFEWPDPDEGAVRFTPDDELAAWLARYATQQRPSAS